jgi:hypothetical protein
MTSRLRILAWVLIMLIAPGLTAAQDEAPSQYLVELVVFRHLDQSKTTAELRRPDKQVLAEPLPMVVFDSAVADIRQLNGTASSLRNLSAYELLAQLAWVQAAEADADTPPVDLNEMGLNGAAATGTARLYERQYLNLDVDITLPATSSMISSSKRVRLNRYYYLDHPDFGVIALVTRADNPAS